MRVITTLLTAILLSAGIATPAQAVPIVTGFAWGNQPANMSYFPATGYEHNSAGLPIQINRPVAGTYQVKFFGMAAPGGVAHASAYGSNMLCTVANWTQMGGDQIVNVRCYNNAGALTDSRFVVNFTNRKPAGTVNFGYLWNDNPMPGPAGHTPAAAYSYDSTGAPITVYRSGVGRYQVALGAFSTDPAWAAGYLRVTPYGAAARHCQVLDPVFAADPSLIEVRCYDDTGFGVDTRFTLTYARKVAMLGGSGARTTATVDLAVNPPVMRGWTNSYGGAPTVIVHPGHTYEIIIPGAGHPKGHAIASIMGTPPMYCTIQSWWQNMGNEHVLVSCFDGNVGVPSPAVLLNVAFIA